MNFFMIFFRKQNSEFSNFLRKENRQNERVLYCVAFKCKQSFTNFSLIFLKFAKSRIFIYLRIFDENFSLFQKMAKITLLLVLILIFGAKNQKLYFRSQCCKMRLFEIFFKHFEFFDEIRH